MSADPTIPGASPGGATNPPDAVADERADEPVSADLVSSGLPAHAPEPGRGAAPEATSERADAPHAPAEQASRAEALAHDGTGGDAEIPPDAAPAPGAGLQGATPSDATGAAHTPVPPVDAPGVSETSLPQRDMSGDAPPWDGPPWDGPAATDQAAEARAGERAAPVGLEARAAALPDAAQSAAGPPPAGGTGVSDEPAADVQGAAAEWAEQPIYAEPPTWGGESPPAAPTYPPLPQWPGPPSDGEAAAGSEEARGYAPPITYSPAVGRLPRAGIYPDYVASMDASTDAPTEAAAAPAPLYAPPPTTSTRLRWPAVLLTVAALAVVVALSLALAGAAFTNLGKSTGPRTLYSNSMTSKTSGWPDDAECSFHGDGYHITSATNCYYSGAAYQDGTVTVTAKLVSGDASGAYGIAFRRPSPNKYFVFLVTGDGNWLVARDNVAVAQAQRNSAIKTGVGAVNKLAIRMKGNHFTFFANGVQLGELTDSAYAGGNVGLAGDSNIEVAFKGFTVTQP